MAMPISHRPTMVAKTLVYGVRSTPTPATISMIPTAIMNPCAGTAWAMNGARYLDQSTSRLVNLSRPATMGTSPKTMRIVDHVMSAARGSLVAVDLAMLEAAAARRG